jgi:ubiquinone/menaquinone biosynthesis C-methylase UbiE
MGQDGSDTYVLRGGEEGAERLRLLARVKWPTTKTLLRRVGLRPGMHCLDVGCGIGAVTLKLARWVGPTGRAVGIDTDERCLELAGQEATRQGLPAVFRREGVNDLREEDAYALVYSRFLLTHLPEPGRALERLVRAARPGGLVAVEDIEFTAHFCHPACPAFGRYVSLYQQAVQRKGGDPDIGPRLVSLLMDAGLQHVGVEVVQPTYRRGPGKRVAQVTMEHIREAVEAAGLASEGEVDAVIADLDRFTRDPRTILSLPRIFQVWGSKAGRPRGKEVAVPSTA